MSLRKGNTLISGTGKDGTNGVSPTASVSKVGSISTLTVTDANGTTTTQILDGGQIIQYPIMPTATSETVGQIVQYTGTTDSTYTNGYFYIGTEDNGTYSWENIQVQASSGGDVSNFGYVEYTNYNTSDTKTKLQNIINKHRETGSFPYLVAKYDANAQYDYCATLIYGDYMYEWRFIHNIDYTSTSSVYMPIKMYYIRANGSIDSDNKFVISTMQRSVGNFYTIGDYNNRPIERNNTTSFVPSADYNPSTKLYTDKTHYENMSGYDATKTQVLKNINGTLTWVDES